MPPGPSALAGRGRGPVRNLHLRRSSWMGPGRIWLACEWPVVLSGRSRSQGQVGLCASAVRESVYTRADFEGLASSLSTASFRQA
eukprot:4242736-Amphidinium_carterae.1